MTHALSTQIQQTMQVRFMGVRGSLPTPGPHTVRYGGNTSCVSVELDPRTVLVLDAGSGILRLGNELLSQRKHIIVMLTHVHWDHHQGFPFFKPIYVPGRKIDIVLHCEEWKAKMKEAMDGSHYFPMKFDMLPSEIRFVSEGIDEFFAGYDVSVTRIRTNHPGLCYGYRIEKDGASMVYMPDNELGTDEHTDFNAFGDFCQDADLLIHDGQYTEAEMPAKRGWGHSVLHDACNLAHQSRVGHLFFSHHDPERDDDALHAMQSEARDYLSSISSDVECSAAAEGLRVSLGDS